MKTGFWIPVGSITDTAGFSSSAVAATSESGQLRPESRQSLTSFEALCSQKKEDKLR